MKKLPGRHGVDIGVVVEAVVDAIQRFIADAVRQRLLPALDPRGGVGAAGVLADEIAEALALHRLLVDVEQPLLHLDAVAGQPDHALDVVGGIVLRQAEHDDIAARRLGAEDAPRKQRRRQRDRIMAVAVGIFRDEQIVADQQRRLHRSRGDVEGLEQEGADHQRDQQRMDDDADGFTQAAFSFCPGCHAHRFPNSRRDPRAVAEHFPHANRSSFRVKKMVLILIVRANSGANPNSLLARSPAAF